MFYEIARNTDVQKRLQEEIDKKSPAGRSSKHHRITVSLWLW